MSKTTKLLTYVGVAALAFGLGAASPASAATTTPPAASDVPSDVQTEIDAIPLPSLQAKVQERVDQLADEGAQVAAIEYAPYAADSPAHGGAVTMALPSGCGLVVVAFLSGSGAQMVNEALTDCGSKTWTRHTLRQRIVAWNPYNSLDPRRTMLDETNTSYSTASYRVRAVSYSCANGNSTNYSMYAAATITVGGTAYSTNAEDVYGFAPCGW